MAGYRTRRFVCVALLAVFAAPAHESLAQSGAGGGIQWRADRPLEWSDFRGSVDPQAPRRAAASTATSRRVGYALELRRVGERCEYEITSVETEAVFLPQESWVRPGQRTASVLEHEQRHFDLAEIHRRMLEHELEDVAGSTRECEDGASMEEVRADAADRVEPIRERVWEALQRVQSEYDAQTDHGLRADAQREWNERIEEALRRGRWR